MYIYYVGFFGINNGMKFIFFHFLDILKSFDRFDICINTYKFGLIVIVTSQLFMFACLKIEHCINILLNFSLKI